MKQTKAIFVMLLFLSVVVFSQVRTGNIYGTVVDQNDRALPGVSVTLSSSKIGNMTTVTSMEGKFRFLSLPPASDYSLKFELEGFKTEIRKDIRVIIGENVTLNVKMEVGELKEEIEVIARPPVIDTKKTTAATNVTREALQSLPTARDPWVILELTPGLMVDRENVGGNESGQQSHYRARGGSQSDSQWNVDGVEVTDPSAPGTSGMYYDYDMFEEMQIQTAGNDVTAMTGGVNINFVTKRGSNDFSGGARFYLTDDEFQADNIPADVEEADLSGNTINQIQDYGLNFGGPIIKDKAWFWASYGVQDISLIDMIGERDETLLKTFNGKLNFTFGNHRIELYGVYNDKIREGRKRYTLDRHEAARKQTGPASIFKIQDEFTVGDNLFISLKGAYTPTSYKLEPYGGRDKHVYEVYHEYRYNTGVWEEYETDIYSASLLANYYKEGFLFGDHEFKLGVDYRYSVTDTGSQFGTGLHLQLRPWSSLNFGTLWREWRLKYYLDRFSVFFQDSITARNITLNLGLRYDRQGGGVKEVTIPGTNVDVAKNIGGQDYNWPDITQPAKDLPFTFNFLSPRIGLIWDVNNDGKTVAKANFAIYGSVLDASYSDIYRIDSYHELDWYDDNNNKLVDSGELYFYRTIDNYDFVTDPPVELFDKDLTSPKDLEVILGIEQEVMKDFAIGGNFIYRRIYNSTWGVPYVWDGDYRLVRNSDWSSYSVNVDGKTYYYWDTYDADVYDEGIEYLTNRPDYYRTYSGLELTFKKRFSRGWMLNGSFTYQDTKVHYDSEDAYLDPTDHKPDDYLDGTSGPHGFGTFVMNSRWLFKLAWLYQLPLDINFGGTFVAREGYIYPEIVTLDNEPLRWWDYDPPVMLTEEFGDSRYPTFWMLNLRLEKQINLKKYGRLYLTVDGFNITNRNTTLRKGNDKSLGTYNVPLEILNPRVFRFGLRYEF